MQRISHPAQEPVCEICHTGNPRSVRKAPVGKRLSAGERAGAGPPSVWVSFGCPVYGRNTDNLVCCSYEKQGFTGEAEEGTDHRKTDNDAAAPHQRRRAPARVP